MAREFSAAVILRNPEDGQTVVFHIGDEVPEWALAKVGDHALSQGVTRSVQSDAGDNDTTTTPAGEESTTEVHTPSYEEEEEDEVPPYEEWSKDDLKSEVKGRELEGLSKATKDELIEALKADDAENGE